MDCAGSEIKYVVHTRSDEKTAQSWMAEGIRCYRIYEESGELRQLDDAIGYAKEGSELTVQRHESHAAYLNIVGVLLGARYEHTGGMKDLEESIDAARRVVQLTLPKHPDLEGRLNNLWNLLGRRFEQSGEMKGPEEAINTACRAVQSTPLDRPRLPEHMKNLGVPLETRFGREKGSEDLEEPYASEADLPSVLERLLRTMYERTSDARDLEGAIDASQQLAQAAPLDHLNLEMRLDNLGNWLGSQFERTGEMKYLEEAIDTARGALQATPRDRPLSVICLNNLGRWIGTRYERTGDTKDLEEAIYVARQALRLIPLDHFERTSYLNNLGNRLGRRFQRTGEMKDLEEAIDIAREVVKSTPSYHSNLSGRLNNLGNWLGSQYEHTGEMKSLEEAIDVARRAVQSTPPNHPDLAACLNNLGSWLGRRFERSEEIKDLEEAIDKARQAVQSTPLDYPDLAMYLNNLGNWLGRQFERTGETKYLEEAIGTARGALQATPRGHPSSVVCLNNLGNWLGSQYERSGEIKDLEEAISVARQALQSTALDDPAKAGRLINLGRWIEKQYERGKKIRDLEELSQCYWEAFYCMTAVPLQRIRAAARCLGRLAELCKPHEGIKLGRDVLALLPIANNRNLDLSDQQFLLSGFAGIASDLCALLLSEGRVHEAVECLEQGRAIIISRLLDDRSDISGLCQEHPKLAERYQSLVAEVNTPFGRAKDDPTANAKLVRRPEAATELEACIGDIRAISDYKRFLLGQTVAEMQEYVSEGYVVIVNISTIRSDAVVMTHDYLQAISFPGLSVTDARGWLSTDWIVRRRSEQREKNDMFLSYLAWLWHVCVRDTLDRISALYKGQGPTLPRVWWIGCGLASSMPFHAAGVHAHGCLENAMSRVLSSYTPSVKALGHSRSQTKYAWSNEPLRDQMLITLMPTTPKGGNDRERFRPLKGVPREEENILQIVSSYVSTIVSTTPDATSVLSQLENCRMAHFACHGMSNPTDPSSSGLVLQRCALDGTPEQDHLSVSRISHLRLKHVQIAYLSACSTAENKAVRLRDEVIHIVSGFQVAGFPHVVGSLWPAGDEECVQVASGFYSSLFENKGVPELGVRRVAWALREAVMVVRAEDIDMPLNWAQFVHFGA
jgi:tetratricopeptide (TPR) repeat protein